MNDPLRPLDAYFSPPDPTPFISATRTPKHTKPHRNLHPCVFRKSAFSLDSKADDTSTPGQGAAIPRRFANRGRSCDNIPEVRIGYPFRQRNSFPGMGRCTRLVLFFAFLAALPAARTAASQSQPSSTQPAPQPGTKPGRPIRRARSQSRASHGEQSRHAHSRRLSAI